MNDSVDITALKEKILAFAKDRDWEQFHSPKNLAMALNVEASELLEIFQWLTQEQSLHISKDPEKFQAVKDELADIFVYLVRIAGVLDINLSQEIESKMKKNAAKYPVGKAKGNAKKYTEF